MHFLISSLSQFCVSVAGFKIADPLSDAVYNPTYATPTLHVIGRTDIIVTEERANGLLKVSANKRIESHDGGELHTLLPSLEWQLIHMNTQAILYHRKPIGANFSLLICTTLWEIYPHPVAYPQPRILEQQLPQPPTETNM